MKVTTAKVPDEKHPEGLDEPLRRPTMDEREEFDAESRAQEPDARVWVVYSPLPGVDYREISKADWKQAGVSDEQEPYYLRWDADNNWRVPKGMMDFLAEGQFNEYILRDGRFKVVEE